MPLSADLCGASIQRPTCPRQHPFQGRAPGPVSGQLSAGPSGWSPRCYGPRFPAAFRPPAFASWTPCPASGIPPPLRSAYRRHPRIPAHVLRTLAGFTRSTRVRPGPGWALSILRGRRCSPTIGRSAVVACRLSTAGPWHPGTAFPTRDVRMTKRQREFPGSRPIPVLPLACGRHGWGDGPWAFPRASHPADQEPATHVTVGTGRTQTRSYVFDIRRTSSTRSLTTCGLVPQPALRPGTGSGDGGSAPDSVQVGQKVCSVLLRIAQSSSTSIQQIVLGIFTTQGTRALNEITRLLEPVFVIYDLG